MSSCISLTAVFEQLERAPPSANLTCHFPYVAGSSLTLEAVPVRERFLLWTHTVSIALRSPLVIRMPKHPCSSR